MTDEKPRKEVKKPEKRVRQEKSSKDFEETADEFSKRKEKIKLGLATGMTILLAGVIITNTTTNIAFTYWTGIGELDLEPQSYISYVASVITTIAIPAFILSLLGLRK